MKQENKLENAIIYVCHAFADDPFKLGSVKLNKILWFADVETLRQLRRTVTGKRKYTVQDHGPVLTDIPHIMKNLGFLGVITSTHEDHVDYQQWIYRVIDTERAEKISQKWTVKRRKYLMSGLGLPK